MNNDPGQTLAKRNWLCIAYAFPPINRSGTHRTAAFVHGLDAAGWKATVLTVVPPKGESLDSMPLGAIPESTEIIAAAWSRPIESMWTAIRALPGFFKRPGKAAKMPSQPPGTEPAKTSFMRTVASLLATPDSRTGWIVPAVLKGLEIIRRRRPEVMYSTSPYASAHIIALILHRLTKVPWVADFRDPWCGNPFSQVRPPIVERWDAWLEKCVLRHVSRIVCATPTMADHFVAAHPAIRSKTSTILNGIDAEVTRHFRPRRLAPAGHFVFLHCGQFYGPRSPSILFKAFRKIVAEFPTRAEKLHLALVGSPNFQGQSLVELAAEAGLSERVIVCGEKTRDKALELSIGADALLLVGAAGRGSELQVPQKLFEYLALKRPILGLISAGNPAAAILKNFGFDGVLCEPDDAAGVAQAMMQLSDPKRKPSPDAWSGVNRYDRSERVAELNQVFLSLAGHRSVGPCGHADSQATANFPRGPAARSNRNTNAASSSIMPASARRIKATQATLLPPAP